MRGTHRTLRVALLVAMALELLLVAGCPRELGVPDASGTACVSTAECNPTLSCGTLRACVLERCEAEPSLFVPCDGGVLIDAAIADAQNSDAF